MVGDNDHDDKSEGGNPVNNNWFPLSQVSFSGLPELRSETSAQLQSHSRRAHGDGQARDQYEPSRSIPGV